jgi:16S rRNA (cytosine1402-N4)-methyltransferase
MDNYIILDSTLCMEKFQNVHIPVLLDSVIEYLPAGKNLQIFDGTFGGGGYSAAFLQQNHRVYATDLDAEAFKRGFDLAKVNLNFSIEHTAFDTGLYNFEDSFFDAIVADLGFSSNQLDHSHRGFSYQQVDDVFDLRYNLESGKPAWQLILELKQPNDLGHIIYRNSGERLSMKMGGLIQQAMTDRMLVSSIVEIIDSNLAPQDKKHKNKILSRIWQAIRIWVNDEFTILDNFLEHSLIKLKAGGRLIIVDFHSLEDKRVTKFMRAKAKPIELDDYGNKRQDFRILTKKAVGPSESEILVNPRSRSGLLRVLEKV